MNSLDRLKLCVQNCTLTHIKLTNFGRDPAHNLTLLFARGFFLVASVPKCWKKHKKNDMKLFITSHRELASKIPRHEYRFAGEASRKERRAAPKRWHCRCSLVVATLIWSYGQLDLHTEERRPTCSHIQSIGLSHFSVLREKLYSPLTWEFMAIWSK